MVTNISASGFRVDRKSAVFRRSASEKGAYWLEFDRDGNLYIQLENT
jgi:hypothetical protein